jgi:hypothetical protein
VDEGVAELEAVASLIARGGYADDEVKLICDGTGPGVQRGVLRIDRREASGRGTCLAVFPGPGRDADSVIEKLLAAEHGAREVLVVSSDRRLMRAASRSGARWETSERFLGELVRAASAPARLPDRPGFAKRTPLDEPSVELWMAELEVYERGLLADVESAEPVMQRSVREALDRALSVGEPDAGAGSVGSAGPRPRGSKPGGGVRRLDDPLVDTDDGPGPGAVRRAAGSSAGSVPPRPHGKKARRPPEVERDAGLEARMLADLERELADDPDLRDALGGPAGDAAGGGRGAGG